MDIDEFIENISLGELSNLYIGLEGQVELHPQNRKKLLNYMNQGLKAISSRFPILKKELIIRGQDHIALYHLRPEYSMSCGTAKVRYIDDRHCDPYKGDLIKILSVYNEIGMEFPLNDLSKNESLFTPSWDTLQITHAVLNQGYSVIYQALYPKMEDIEGGCRTFHLPPLLEEALVNFVAGKVYSHMNGQENKATSQEFMGVFEQKCAETAEFDLAATSAVSTNHKSSERGFI